jgi:predicted nucleotidyltransferase
MADLDQRLRTGLLAEGGSEFIIESMNRFANIDVPQDEIAVFCRRHRIRKLAFFGSVLRSDFEADSDVDVLIEFEAGAAVGLIRLAGMELELSDILGGRKVDLNTPNCLSRYFRQDVLAEAEVHYAAP